MASMVPSAMAFELAPRVLTYPLGCGGAGSYRHSSRRRLRRGVRTSRPPRARLAAGARSDLGSRPPRYVAFSTYRMIPTGLRFPRGTVYVASADAHSHRGGMSGPGRAAGATGGHGASLLCHVR